MQDCLCDSRALEHTFGEFSQLNVGRRGEADELEKSGHAENTLVIYTADQGFSMGEHGFRTKLAPYDANYRSPLIFSMPGTRASPAMSISSSKWPTLPTIAGPE